MWRKKAGAEGTPARNAIVVRWHESVRMGRLLHDGRRRWLAALRHCSTATGNLLHRQPAGRWSHNHRMSSTPPKNVNETRPVGRRVVVREREDGLKEAGMNTSAGSLLIRTRRRPGATTKTDAAARWATRGGLPGPKRWPQNAGMKKELSAPVRLVVRWRNNDGLAGH